LVLNPSEKKKVKDLKAWVKTEKEFIYFRGKE
jgi:hypothetical protein